MPTSVYLSIITPLYNESQNITRGTLVEVLNFLNSQTFSWEWILVNDGSSDETLAQVTRFAKSLSQVTVVDNPHMGKAASITTGVEKSTGQIILFSDMDQATPISELDKLLPYFKAGADIVIGSRSSRREGAPFLRRLMAIGMIVLRTVVLRLPFKDTQCGFKAFTREAANRIFPTLRRIHPPKVITGPAVNPGFDIELLYIGRKLGLKIIEAPVIWRHRVTERVSFRRDAIKGLQELLLVRYRAFTNAYKL